MRVRPWIHVNLNKKLFSIRRTPGEKKTFATRDHGTPETETKSFRR